LAVEETAAMETAVAAIADGAAMPDVTAVPFASFLAFDEPFLGRGTAAAVQQVAAAISGILGPAVDEVAAAITAVVAAVAEGVEMPDGALVPK
jgi:hypothetical protein